MLVRRPSRGRPTRRLPCAGPRAGPQDHPRVLGCPTADGLVLTSRRRESPCGANTSHPAPACAPGRGPLPARVGDRPGLPRRARPRGDGADRAYRPPGAGQRRVQSHAVGDGPGCGQTSRRGPRGGRRRCRGRRRGPPARGSWPPCRRARRGRSRYVCRTVPAQRPTNISGALRSVLPGRGVSVRLRADVPRRCTPGGRWPHLGERGGRRRGRSRQGVAGVCPCSARLTCGDACVLRW